VNNLGDHLRKRAEQLRLDRGDGLFKIQSELDRRYPGQCRALSLNNGLLRLITPSSAIASELRLNQVELLNKFRSLGEPIERMTISIRSL
jgi:hypothetical protein